MSEADIAIAVVPYRKWPTWNPKTFPLDELSWPYGQPERCIGGRIADLRADDHLISMPRSSVFLLPRFGIKAQISVMIVEPDIIHQEHLTRAARLFWRFYKVMTKNAELLAKIPNGAFLYYGTTFIEDPDSVNRHKSEMVSIIASQLRQLKGHQLRHEIVDYMRSKNIDVSVMGRGYQFFKKKEDGLAPYRYSIVIENTREKDYFTEKIVDACLCDTVPIYWGAPNISEYYDVDGLIICESKEEIIAAISQMSLEDYNKRKKAIKENRMRSFDYIDLGLRAANIVRASLNVDLENSSRKGIKITSSKT